MKIVSMARTERLARAIAALMGLYLVALAVRTIVVPDPKPLARALEVVIVRVAIYGLLSLIFWKRAAGKAKMDHFTWAVFAIMAVASCRPWEDKGAALRSAVAAVVLVLGGLLELRLAAGRAPASTPSSG